MPGIPSTEPKNLCDLRPSAGQTLRADLDQHGAKARTLVHALRVRLTPYYQRLLSFISAAWEKIQRLPRRLRLAGAALVILLIGALICSSALSSSAKLNVICQHSFRSAEVSIWIDDNLVYTGTVNGSAKKRFSLFGSGRTKARFKTIDVPAGRHTVQVRLNAEAEGYDRIKTLSAVFAENQDNSLTIGAGARGLSLAARSAENLPVENTTPSPYSKYLGSAVLSIFASVMSAAIAFIVQEFLRSQKARLAAAPSATEVKS